MIMEHVDVIVHQAIEIVIGGRKEENTFHWKIDGKSFFAMCVDFNQNVVSIIPRCIRQGRCQLPQCEYGNYDKKNGHCPTKEDKLAAGFAHRSYN